MTDLHMHSTFSDGLLTPTQLVDRGYSIDLEVMALTDHNTIDGVPEFLKAIEKYFNIKGMVVSELTANYGKGNLHILALNIKNIENFSKYI